MKRTGPTKEKAKKVIALLEKTARKTKSGIWLDLAERLSMPRRKRSSVNLWKIGKVAGIFPEKKLVVPGKVLAKGMLLHKSSVIAFEFSKEAKEKIKKAGGKALSMEEAIAAKVAAKEMVIVK